MAREFHRTRLSIWERDRYLDLTPAAQHLHYVLSTDPSLSYCGVVDWRPARLTARARGWTEEAIRLAAAELEHGEIVLFDETTEEALVWQHIGEDELLRNPKLAVAVASAYGSVASRRLRAAVVSEIRRVRKECPDYSSWTHKISEKHLDRLLNLTPLDQWEITNGITNRITNPVGNAITNHIINENANNIANDIGDADRSESVMWTGVENTNRITDPDRSTSYLQLQQQQQHIGGHLTGVRHQGEPLAASNAHPQESEQDSDSDEFADRLRAAEAALGPRPDPWCERHPGGTDQPCRECQAHRRRLERWTTERHRIRAQIAEARRAAIAECDLCDTEGWRIPPPALDDPPVARCDHHPDLPAPWLALLSDQPTEDTADA